MSSSIPLSSGLPYLQPITRSVACSFSWVTDQVFTCPPPSLQLESHQASWLPFAWYPWLNYFNELRFRPLSWSTFKHHHIHSGFLCSVCYFILPFSIPSAATFVHALGALCPDHLRTQFTPFLTSSVPMPAHSSHCYWIEFFKCISYPVAPLSAGVFGGSLS